MSDGQESKNLQQIPTDSKNRLPKHYESNNNLRTFQAENIKILKNRQLQTNFTDSYRKRVYCEGPGGLLLAGTQDL